MHWMGVNREDAFALHDPSRGEESPDTIGQDSPCKRGCARRKPRATESVTENIPPRACARGQGEMAG